MTDTFAMAPRRLPVSTRQRVFDKFQRGYVMFAFMIYEGAFTSTLRYLRGGDEHLLPGQTDIASTVAQTIILTILCWMWWLRRRHLVDGKRIRSWDDLQFCNQIAVVVENTRQGPDRV